VSTLRLRIDKYLEGNLSRPPQVIATISPLGESGGGLASGRKPLQRLIPITHVATHAESVDLEPGRYYVETVLPSGEVLAGDVSLASGQTKDLVLHAEYSPHEWLSWQHLMGNVSTTPAPRKRARRGKGGALAGVKIPVAATDTEAVFEGAAGAEEEPASPPRPEVDLERPISCLSNPYPPLAHAPDGRDVWPWLAKARAWDETHLLHELNGGQPLLEVSAADRDDAHAVFRLSLSTTAANRTFALGGKVAPADRYYAAVSRRQSIELVSLPIPWRVVTTGREAEIEIAVQQPAEDGGFCASATAADEQLGMLLGFLSSGSLPTVRQMAEAARDMLYGKYENPLAAAAGGYALVGTAHEAVDKEWHGWVGNLMRSFAWIPDGAIQWGQLRLRMRRDANDIKEARDAFKTAYGRGLPFYSMGMRWLMDGLEWFSRDDAEAKTMLENVRQLAWRTNYQQPFTILKLGGDSV
jgi:hypothetical protein